MVGALKKILSVTMLFLLVCCSNESGKGKKIDEFYTEKGGLDYGRIPLIKPYEAIVPATGNQDWIVHSVTDTTLFTIPGVKEGNVIDSIICLHGINTLINYQPVEEGWFVIVPKRDVVKSFQLHQEYLKFLRKLGRTSEPRLYKMHTVFSYFDSNDFIDWKKLNQEL